MAKYKQLCSRCKRNYIPMTWRNRYPVCYDCQKRELDQEVKDPKMKRLFNISEEYYKKNSFLRSIKINYLRYGELSERQIDAFKESIKTMKKEEKEEKASESNKK